MDHIHDPLLIKDVRHQLDEFGYSKIPKSLFCLDAESIEELRHEFDAVFHGRYETGVYPDEIHWRPGISRDNVTREVCNGWKASRKIRKVVCSERLGALACTLMNWTASRIGQDDLLHKPPGSNAVGFHQDSAYISDNFANDGGNKCLTMWIALDDTDADNGALQYIPESHTWKDETQQDVPASQSNNMANSVEDSSFHLTDKDDPLASVRRAARRAGVTDDLSKRVETVPHVSAGEMVVHHQWTWHGSLPNVSKKRVRRSLVAHLIQAQCQWREQPPPHYIYGRYWIRGESTLRDDFFPITFVKEESCDEDSQHESRLLRTPWLDD